MQVPALRLQPFPGRFERVPAARRVALPGDARPVDVLTPAGGALVRDGSGGLLDVRA
jgi:hypothetical protein